MHQDHLGSSVASTTAAGAIAWREDTTPYGEKRLDPNANKDDEGFTGHISDAATDLTYMQARYYDPVIGRFLSNDPVGLIQGGTGYFNRYAYVANNPINATDPTGKYICYKCTEEQADALRASLAHARKALTTGKLSRSKKKALKRALDAYGKEGEAGVAVTFLSDAAFENATGSETTYSPNGATKYFKDKDVSVVVFRDSFPDYYKSLDGPNGGFLNGQPKGSGPFNSKDERANIVAHEGNHIADQKACKCNNVSEAPAYRVGSSVNEGHGSQPLQRRRGNRENE